MAESSKESAMRRKAGAGRAPPEIGRVDAARVLRAAVAQGAEDALGLTANALKVLESRSVITAFTESLPECALLTLCEGPNDQFGLVVFDPQSLAALIEVQTTGRVVPSPAKPRAPTRTDALLTQGFIDTVLQQFEDGAAEAELDLTSLVTGYRYVMAMADIRAVIMTMPDIPYRIFELDIDFSEGAKSGKMLILLPFQAVSETPSETNADWQADLSEAVQCTQVEMDGILARKEMLLSEVADFQIGTLLPLPREVVSQIKIEDIDGVSISQGRLGQSNGFRAICISQPCAEDGLPAPGFDLGNTQSTGGLDDFAMGDNAGDPLPNLSAIPAIDAPTGLADLGSAPPDLPDLPDLGDMGGGGDGLSDLGALDTPSDLPDLGDLPDLANLGDMGGGSGLPELPDIDVA